MLRGKKRKDDFLKEDLTDLKKAIEDGKVAKEKQKNERNVIIHQGVLLVIKISAVLACFLLFVRFITLCVPSRCIWLGTEQIGIIDEVLKYFMSFVIGNFVRPIDVEQ